MLSVSNEMTVGQSGGSSNTLVISAGGQVLDHYSRIGDFDGSNNYVLVTGSSSLWSVDNLYVGYLSVASTGNTQAINSNGTVLALSITASPNNSIKLSQGILTVIYRLQIYINATLSGCGTINGSVIIDKGGTVLADCDGKLTFTGIVTNNGTMRAINGSVLVSYGTLVNNGIIDIIDSSTNFHGTFINNGVVLDASSVGISSISISGDNVVIQIPSATGHTYQMQTTPALTPVAWTNSYPAQAGTDGVLTFTDPGGVTNDLTRFYRIDVTSP